MGVFRRGEGLGSRAWLRRSGLATLTSTKDSPSNYKNIGPPRQGVGNGPHLGSYKLHVFRRCAKRNQRLSLLRQGRPGALAEQSALHRLMPVPGALKAGDVVAAVQLGVVLAGLGPLIVELGVPLAQDAEGAVLV